MAQETSVARLDAWIDERRDEIVKALQGALQIPSLKAAPEPDKPFGPTIAQALEYFLDRARRFGLRVRNVDGYVGDAEWGEGRELIGVLAHVDVVPEGEGWSHPPYGGEIHDGRIYGRGATDDKGPAIAALFALAAISELKLPVQRRVRLILGGDEESGFACVNYYFAREEKPTWAFSPDAEFPIVNAEKGIWTFVLDKALGKAAGPHIVSLQGGRRPNMVPERAVATLHIPNGADEWMRLVSRQSEGRKASFRVERTSSDDAQGTGLIVGAVGVSAHASTPEKGVNAVTELLSLLWDVWQAASAPLEHPSASVLRFLAGGRLGANDGSGLEISCNDAVSGHLTSNLGILDWNRDSIAATFNIRYPVTVAMEPLRDKVKALAASGGFEFREVSNDPPHHVAADSFLVRTLREVYEGRTGQKADLLSMGGGTYARVLPTAVAFGPMFPGQASLAHEKDEHIEIDHIIQCTKIYAHAVYALMSEV